MFQKKKTSKVNSLKTTFRETFPLHIWVTEENVQCTCTRASAFIRQKTGKVKICSYLKKLQIMMQIMSQKLSTDISTLNTDSSQELYIFEYNSLYIMLLIFPSCRDQQYYTQTQACELWWGVTYTSADWHIYLYISKWLRWIVIPVLVALLFLLPEGAIDFHSSKASCCTRLLQAIWPQFKAHRQRRVSSRGPVLHTVQQPCLNITKPQQDKCFCSSKPRQIVLSHKIPGPIQLLGTGKGMNNK